MPIKDRFGPKLIDDGLEKDRFDGLEKDRISGLEKDRFGSKSLDSGSLMLI